MPDTIEQRIREAAARPSTTPDFDELAARGRRQRRAVWTGSALAVVLLGAVGIATVTTSSPNVPLISEGPSPTPTVIETDRAAALPFGWTDVTVADARLGVPPGWNIRRQHPDDLVCANTAQTIWVLDPAVAPRGHRACNASLPGGPVIVAAPLSELPQEWKDSISELPTTPVAAGSLSGERLLTDTDDARATYRFTDVDLYVGFSYTERFPGLVDDVLATLAPADQERSDGPSSIEPFPTDTALIEPRTLPSEEPGIFVDDLLMVRPWDHGAGTFEPEDAADRHLVVTALANTIWGPRYAGTHFTGTSTVIFIVDATDRDRRWLQQELTAHPATADTDFAMESVQRPLHHLIAMAEAIEQALPERLTEQVQVRIEVVGNVAVVFAPDSAHAEQVRDVLRNAPDWVEVHETTPSDSSSTVDDL